MTKALDQRCSYPYISEGGGSVRPHQCRNKATTVEEGKPYCTIHTPSKIKARREKEHARFEAEFALRIAQDVRHALRSRQADLFPELLAAAKAALLALESPEAQKVLAWTGEREDLKAIISKAQGH